MAFTHIEVDAGISDSTRSGGTRKGYAASVTLVPRERLR